MNQNLGISEMTRLDGNSQSRRHDAGREQHADDHRHHNKVRSSKEATDSLRRLRSQMTGAATMATQAQQRSTRAMNTASTQASQAARAANNTSYNSDSRLQQALQGGAATNAAQPVQNTNLTPSAADFDLRTVSVRERKNEVAEAVREIQHVAPVVPLASVFPTEFPTADHSNNGSGGDARGPAGRITLGGLNTDAAFVAEVERLTVGTVMDLALRHMHSQYTHSDVSGTSAWETRRRGLQVLHGPTYRTAVS